jgi:lysophospholipase L1-like esterase
VERRWQFFDPDHMSAAGAREFSAALAPRLSQWITAEGGK